MSGRQRDEGFLEGAAGILNTLVPSSLPWWLHRTATCLQASPKRLLRLHFLFLSLSGSIWRSCCLSAWAQACLHTFLNSELWPSHPNLFHSYESGLLYRHTSLLLYPLQGISSWKNFPMESCFPSSSNFLLMYYLGSRDRE